MKLRGPAQFSKGHSGHSGPREPGDVADSPEPDSAVPLDPDPALGASELVGAVVGYVVTVGVEVGYDG